MLNVLLHLGATLYYGTHTAGLTTLILYSPVVLTVAHSADAEYRIANARQREVRFLPNIELAASTLLVGHAPASILNETTSEQDLLEAQAAGRLWVALTGSIPVGFAYVKIFGSGGAHLEEIDVHPDHGRRGLGTRLVLTACEWAASCGYPELTLTTFRDVPWNMPFYARLGFQEVPQTELSAELLMVVSNETRKGLDPSRRVVMRRKSASKCFAGR